MRGTCRVCGLHLNDCLCDRFRADVASLEFLREKRNRAFEDGPRPQATSKKVYLVSDKETEPNELVDISANLDALFQPTKFGADPRTLVYFTIISLQFGNRFLDLRVPAMMLRELDLPTFRVGEGLVIKALNIGHKAEKFNAYIEGLTIKGL